MYITIRSANRRIKVGKISYFQPKSVRIGKNGALGLEYSPWPVASANSKDLGHKVTFSWDTSRAP